jgi:hypothetical protein
MFGWINRLTITLIHLLKQELRGCFSKIREKHLETQWNQEKKAKGKTFRTLLIPEPTKVGSPLPKNES